MSPPLLFVRGAGTPHDPDRQEYRSYDKRTGGFKTRSYISPDKYVGRTVLNGHGDSPLPNPYKQIFPRSRASRHAVISVSEFMLWRFVANDSNIGIENPVMT